MLRIAIWVLAVLVVAILIEAPPFESAFAKSVDQSSTLSNVPLFRTASEPAVLTLSQDPGLSYQKDNTSEGFIDCTTVGPGGTAPQARQDNSSEAGASANISGENDSCKKGGWH